MRLKRDSFGIKKRTRLAGECILYGSDTIPSYAASARGKDFSHLPYTYTCVGQLDPFRSETLTYVTKLAEAVVDVEFHLFLGAYHGFEGINPYADLSIRAKDEYILAVMNGFKRSVKVE